MVISGAGMKPPCIPPAMEGLLKKHVDQLPRLLTLRAAQGEYLHWDKLRHLQPPDGLNHEQWWMLLKLMRAPTMKWVPLIDTAGRPFGFSLPDEVQERLHHIDSRASGRIELPEQVTNEESRERYIFKSLVEEAITSSQMEGASTTRQVALDMIRFGRRPRDVSERMIFNNHEAMGFIRRHSREPLTPGLVKELHGILTRDTLENSADAGQLQRPGDQRVEVVDNASQRVLHTPPPAEQLEERLERMCAFANAEAGSGEEGFIHPIIRALVLHFWLAYDHPFVDGNGRTARAIFYWSMLSQGYWLFEYLSISRILKRAPARYGRSFLFTESDDNDLTYFINYQLEVMEQAVEELEEYLKRKIEEYRKLEERLRNHGAFNHRQIALLGHALRHPGAEYTVRSHQTSHNIAYATARSDLFLLVDMGLLIKMQSNKKSAFFRAVADIESRI